MRTSLLLLALVALMGLHDSAHPVQAQGYIPGGRRLDARIWIDNEPSFFRRGDRLNVRFSLSSDAYVAIIHIDPVGTLDIVYPASPWDDEFVRGGRVHSLRPGGIRSGWTVRSGPGIGYLYLIASPTPLDFQHFRGRAGSGWEWGYAGRVVHGDPFLAFEQISRLLVPFWPGTPYGTDFYTYHVDGIHSYPNYACSERYYGSGWGWTPAFGSCSRMDLFLRQYPNYYDTRRFRGDRRAYLGEYERYDPRHGFKEDPVRTGGTPSSTPRSTPGRGSDPRAPLAPSVGAAPQRGATPVRPPAPPREPAPAAPAPERAPARSPAPSREPAPAAPAPERAPARAPAPARDPVPAAPASGRAPARAPA